MWLAWQSPIAFKAPNPTIKNDGIQKETFKHVEI